MQNIQQKLKNLTDNPKSLLRPGWTSEKCSGNFKSYNHQHGFSFRWDFFVRSQGLDGIARTNAGKPRSK
ncbi:hypothetical protein LCGC14_0475410 [marine sediment metagenome]|uniref:Uncharacterized protein n=1 Tax=marine sediment metagenome TaxID=412755 RepID=A0A0F9VJP5_9ZZZZ